MKPVTISEAKRIGQAIDADGVLVLAVKDGEWAMTTYGRTRRECSALREWGGGHDAANLAYDMAELLQR